MEGIFYKNGKLQEIISLMDETSYGVLGLNACNGDEKNIGRYYIAVAN